MRWIPAPNLHLTLRFLGDTASEAIPRVLAAVEQSLAGRPEFDLNLAGIGALPSPSRPRVVIARLQEDARLTELAHAVERAAVACGFAPEERSFRAHITLGRFQRLRRGERRAPVAIERPVETATFPVRNVVLFRSDLRKEGAHYTEIGRVALAASRATQ